VTPIWEDFQVLTANNSNQKPQIFEETFLDTPKKELLSQSYFLILRRYLDESGNFVCAEFKLKKSEYSTRETQVQFEQITDTNEITSKLKMILQSQRDYKSPIDYCRVSLFVLRTHRIFLGKKIWVDFTSWIFNGTPMCCIIGTSKNSENNLEKVTLKSIFNNKKIINVPSKALTYIGKCYPEAFGVMPKEVKEEYQKQLKDFSIDSLVFTKETIGDFDRFINLEKTYQME